MLSVREKNISQSPQRSQRFFTADTEHNLPIVVHKEFSVIRFIADVNVEKRIIDCLIKLGFDVKWIPDYDCEMNDADLLAMATNENRILITNDKDFGELVFLRKQNFAGIILIRVKGQNTKEKVNLVEKLILNYKEKLPDHFSIITKTKFRFIPLEDII